MEIVALILEMYPPSSILSCLTDNRLIWRDLNNLRKRLNNVWRDVCFEDFSYFDTKTDGAHASRA
uniref:Uncharacterized protein n=1 Tax=Lepeophtheirus salmonis TaxID=72036 RepID=A0A0K2VER5_LEPSM